MKVVIPTAGIGSRLGKLTEYYNKCMIPIGEKPMLSYIIDRYPKETKFVIAAGYKKDYVKQYLKLAYPEKDITVVDVDKFVGPGSGLGYSLSKCEEHLQEPFMFHTNDSVVLDDFQSFPNEDTMFVSKKNVNPKIYRTVAKDENNKVIKVYDKTTEHLDGIYNYVGISFINKYKEFWKVLNEVTADIGETYYFQSASDINAFELKRWYDIGNIEQLQIAKNEIAEFKNLEKPKESLYFIKNNVLKFSVDETFISERIKRAKYLGDVVPSVVGSSKNFYVYEHVSGEVLSQIINITDVLEDLLKWSIKNLWIPSRLGQKEKHGFRDMCFNFYYEKTLNRINDFYKIYDATDVKEIINGVGFEKLSSILENLDWHSITNGVPTGFHGDFCFDNIIKIKDGYKLI
ncbi:MAG: hypothetical protein KAW47_10300, partial [Thermoplasmatales archaeon]|nr:hypothetical protein [Thermoplasmatales archaeon]